MPKIIFREWTTKHFSMVGHLEYDKHYDGWRGVGQMYTIDRDLRMAMNMVYDEAKNFITNIVNEYGKPSFIDVFPVKVQERIEEVYNVEFTVLITYETGDLYSLEYVIKIV